MDPNSQQGQILQTLLALNAANPTNQSIANTVLDQALQMQQPEQDPAVARKEQLMNAMMQMEIEKLGAGDASAMSRLNQLVEGGYDAYTQGVGAQPQGASLGLEGASDQDKAASIANQLLMARQAGMQSGNFGEYNQLKQRYGDEFDIKEGQALEDIEVNKRELQRTPLAGLLGRLGVGEGTQDFVTFQQQRSGSGTSAEDFVGPVGVLKSLKKTPQSISDFFNPGKRQSEYEQFKQRQQKLREREQ